MKNISVLVSGGGTNLQAVIDKVENRSGHREQRRRLRSDKGKKSQY